MSTANEWLDAFKDTITKLLAEKESEREESRERRDAARHRMEERDRMRGDRAEGRNDADYIEELREQLDGLLQVITGMRFVIETLSMRLQKEDK